MYSSSMALYFLNKQTHIIYPLLREKRENINGTSKNGRRLGTYEYFKRRIRTFHKVQVREIKICCDVKFNN